MQKQLDMNDDLAIMIDNILGRPGIRTRYEKGECKDWIGLVGDQNLKEGLRALPETEQKIIEKFFLQRKTLIDIAYDLGMSMDLLRRHIDSIRVRLESYD